MGEKEGAFAPFASEVEGGNEYFLIPSFANAVTREYRIPMRHQYLVTTLLASTLEPGLCNRLTFACLDQ